MKCPNCGSTIPTGYHCPNCDVDAYVFQKSKTVSIRLYNQALEKARENDLSGAAEQLEQSLVFDKNNLQARNLLGLVYYETGRIAEALRHWIISTSYETENNPAESYINCLQKNAREMEKRNDAVRMYNQALLYLQQNSDDLAIIQLKKSLDVNPDFLDAYNLLTLCCIMEKNYKRARQFIETVLKKDIKNPYALRYLQYLEKIGQASSKQAHRLWKNNNGSGKMLKTDSAPPIPHYKRNDRKKSGLLEKRDFFSFAIGLIVSATFLLVLVAPALSDEKDKKISDLTAQVKLFSGETHMTAEEVKKMRTEFQKLQKENKLLRSEETKQANLELLETAYSQMTDKDIQACVQTLDSIETVGFSEEDMAKYNTIKSTMYPKAAELLYNKGKSEFLNKEYETAKTNLENALRYADKEEFVGDILFYLGDIAAVNKDTATAKTYYERVLSEFPNSKQIENVKISIKELEKTTAE